VPATFLRAQKKQENPTGSPRLHFFARAFLPELVLEVNYLFKVSDLVRDISDQARPTDSLL